MNVLQVALQRRTNILVKNEKDLDELMLMCREEGIDWANGYLATDRRTIAEVCSRMLEVNGVKIYLHGGGRLMYSDASYNNGEPFEEFNTLKNMTGKWVAFKY